MALLPHTVVFPVGDALAAAPSVDLAHGEPYQSTVGPTTEELTLLPEVGARYWRIQGWSSNALPTPRDLFVHLPEAYWSEPERKFPVLLMHDGQNLFDGELSYVKGSTWRAAETADREIAAGAVEPLILIGIGNTGHERMAEYTPTPDTRLGGGKGPLYAKALVVELLPVAERDLRLTPGPANMGIAGSSLGGLISLAIALQYPQVFGKVGVLSPSLWWDSRAVLDEGRALQTKLPLRIWVDMGTAEGAVHLRDTEALTHLLQHKGWVLDGGSMLPRSAPRPSGMRETPGAAGRTLQASGSVAAEVHYERVPHGLHNEAAWAARFGDVLRFLFPAGSQTR